MIKKKSLKYHIYRHCLQLCASKGRQNIDSCLKLKIQQLYNSIYNSIQLQQLYYIFKSPQDIASSNHSYKPEAPLLLHHEYTSTPRNIFSVMKIPSSELSFLCPFLILTKKARDNLPFSNISQMSFLHSPNASLNSFHQLREVQWGCGSLGCPAVCTDPGLRPS